MTARRVGAVCALVAVAGIAMCQPTLARGRGHYWHHHHHVVRLAHAHREPRRLRPIVNGRSDRVSIALRYLGASNPTGTHGPWCGDFMNMVERLAGRHGISSRMAIDWARYGHASGPQPGAIAVQRGHVAIVMRRVGARLQIISGNWTHRVGIGWIGLRSVVAFRSS